MAHTTDIIVHDMLGNLMMIVLLDDDRQLNDPAWTLQGGIQLRVPAMIGGTAEDITTQAIAAAAAKGVTVQLIGTTGATGATGPSL